MKLNMILLVLVDLKVAEMECCLAEADEGQVEWSQVNLTGMRMLGLRDGTERKKERKKDSKKERNKERKRDGKREGRSNGDREGGGKRRIEEEEEDVCVYLSPEMVTQRRGWLTD